MKAAALTGIREMTVTDVPEPKIENNDDVLLKIELVGVCGSDMHYYLTGGIGSERIRFPFIIGHECAATVKDAGNSVTRVKAGDKVAVDPAVVCHQCEQCKMGRENTCRNLKFLGCPGQLEGCLSEYIVMPEHSCFPVGDKLSLTEAVLCEPLAIAVYAVRRAGLNEDSNIAILGAGPIGLSCMKSAKAESVRNIYMTEKIPERVNIAKKAGAVWVGNPDERNIVEEILRSEPAGMDVVFECAGRQETLDQAVDLLRPGGKLMLIGIPEKDRVSFVIDKLRRKEITIINVRRQNKCTQKAVNLVAAEKIDVDFMVTHRFKLQQVQQAFDLVADYKDGVVKAMIEI